MAASTWFEIPSPFETTPGSVLLADPPNVGARKLRAMLRDESYPKPFVIDDGELLTLYFNIRLIQSVMRLDSPDTLELRYTRKMMAFLLFNPKPKRIALIGVGGGSMVKYCHRHLPACHITAIESDADVLAFRDAFKLPPNSPCLQLLQADGVDWLAKAEQGIDALLVDAFDKTGVAPALASRDFFESCFARLSAHGQLVINLAGDKRRFRGLIDEVSDVFNNRVIVVPVRGDGNSVLFAFKQTRFAPNWRRLGEQATVLQKQFGLDFPDFASKLEKARGTHR